jgi:hypothetical protein
MVVKLLQVATNYNELDIWSLIDGGANICIMGLLDLLVEVMLIPPLPISVATKKVASCWMIAVPREDFCC